MSRLEDACCMSCTHWRYTQQGKGECMSLNIYTEEGFGCTDFLKEDIMGG